MTSTLTRLLTLTGALALGLATPALASEPSGGDDAGRRDAAAMEAHREPGGADQRAEAARMEPPARTAASATPRPAAAEPQIDYAYLPGGN